MTFLRRRETSRISSRGKGPVYNIGGVGCRALPIRPTSILTFLHRCSFCVADRHKKSVLALKKLALGFTTDVKSINCIAKVTLKIDNVGRNCLSLQYLSKVSIACMIIDDGRYLRKSQKQKDSTITQQQYLTRLVSHKHRTTKLTSNRHRKLKSFRNT